MIRPGLTLAVGRALALSGALATAPSAWAIAQEPAPAASQPADDLQGAIRGHADKYVAAFNAGDAAALSRFFRTDARLILPDGTVLDGQAAIAAHFQDLFTDQGGLKLSVQINELRRIGTETVVESGVATLKTPAGQTQANPFTALLVRHDGGWSLAELRESDPQLPRTGRLDELTWLLGDWIEEGPDAVVSLSATWEDPERRNYLIRKFTVKVQGRTVLSGSQRLGFDAGRGLVRAWLFDAEGGFAEETWTPAGPDRWLVQASGVDAEGLRGTSTHLVIRESAHRARIEVLARTIAGRALTDLDTRILVRPPAAAPAPAPGSSPTEAK